MHYGEHVHWDLWGPALMSTLGRKHYAAFQKDDHSQETAIYFLAKKSNMLEAYKKDKAAINT
jgi:hypothetical protein